MQSKRRIPADQHTCDSKCRIVGPGDPDAVLEFFSLVLEKADQEQGEGRMWDVPFASFLILARHNRVSTADLEAFLQIGAGGSAWPSVLQRLFHPASETRDRLIGRGTRTDKKHSPYNGMVIEVLRFALGLAKPFEVNAPQICRVLAAVGQTLRAHDRRFADRNRSIADQHRLAARARMTSASPAAREEVSHILIEQAAPWQADYRNPDEEGGSVRLDGLVLWHGSCIGPRSAAKSQNQDATFALTSPEMSSPAYLVFALADGVTTSMGSRLAATTIVRRFCEFVVQHITIDKVVDNQVLTQAARQTQASLDELTRTLLSDCNSYAFESVRGSDVHPKTATRILQNTLEPSTASIPAALSATLIGGIVRPGNDSGTYHVELLRIGDGTVEVIDAAGNLESVFDTDPDIFAVSEVLGPGPRARALFDEHNEQLSSKTLNFGKGEVLIVSSDGLARGHREKVSTKLSELLGEAFWKTTRPQQADGALRLLRHACQAADRVFELTSQLLFDDNLSLVMIRAGEEP